MGYRVKGTLKLPDGSPASNAEIEFISRKNFSPLVQELKSNILCGLDGAYDVTLEYGEYAVLVYPGGTYPAALGAIILATDTVAGQDLPSLLQQSGWQPATPEYILQIQTWLLESRAYAEAALASKNAAKVSQDATKNSETAAASSASSALASKNAAAASATSASGSASTATTKASEAASSASAALASKNAAATSEVNALASKNAAATSESNALASKNASATSATSASGSATTATTKATEAAASAASAASAVASHEAKDGAHKISGVNGLQAALDGKLPSNAVSTHEAKPNAHPISGVAGLQEALDKAGGDPVLSSAWVQLRTAMWSGYVPADGGVFNRVDYPDAWSAIQSSKVPVVSEADWLGNPLNRGSFTTGDGATTFRVPDYNGKMADAIGAVFMRGDGKNSAGTNGLMQGDVIRNITGVFWAAPHNDGANTQIISGASGLVRTEKAAGGNATGVSFSGTHQATSVTLDASRVVPTGPENRPVAVTGCWAIKLFGAVQNAGSIDAAGLATQVAGLQSSKLDIANIVGPIGGGSVIESGSNANGSWVKYADGTLICSIIKTLAGFTSSDIPLNAVATNSINNIQYPVQFSLTPALVASYPYSGNEVIVPQGGYQSVGDSGCSYLWFKRKLASGTTIVPRIHMILSGRWK